MQTQRSSGLIELLKENMALRAEISALIDILKVSDLTGQRPAEWRATLNDVRRSRAYRDAVEQYDALLARLEDATTRAEIDFLLQKISLREPLR